MIAADINNTNSVTTFDVLVLRKVLLFIQDTFVNTDSWRFVPADYDFSNPNAPFEDDFPESLSCATIQNGSSADFIGIKVGDVTGNANPAMLETADPRTAGRLQLRMENLFLEKGKSYRLPVYADDFEAMIGLQLGLDLGRNIRLDNIEAAGISDFDESHYFYQKETGILRLSWSNPYSTNIKKEMPLIYLNISVLNGVRLSEVVELNDEIFRAEAYNEKQEIFEPKLTFEGAENLRLQSLKVSPNPFSISTILEYEALENGNFELSVFSSDGRLIHHQSGSLQKGQNQIELDTQLLRNPGIYIYQLNLKDEQYTGKLIKQKS